MKIKIREVEIPMGVSEWLSHGKTYGYYDYFQNAVRRGHTERIHAIWWLGAFLTGAFIGIVFNNYIHQILGWFIK